MFLNSKLLVVTTQAVADTVAAVPKGSTKAAELIKDGDVAGLGDMIILWGIGFLQKLIIAIIIFLIGKLLINLIKKLLNKRVNNKPEKDTVLRKFINSFIVLILYAVLFLIILNVIGTKSVSIMAIIGALGFAIGFAVKDNLANFAGGVMLLFNRPFNGGDYIQAQGLEGTVKNIGILYTRLITVDNKTIYIPNGPLSTGNITNFSQESTRRVDLPVSVDYGTDIELVKKLLLNMAENHPKVLKNPAPMARMTKMNDSSIDFAFRVWVNKADYWDVLFDLNEQTYNVMNENGIDIPFPQMTVHMAKE